MHQRKNTQSIATAVMASAILVLGSSALAAGTIFFADIFNPGFENGSIRRIETNGSGLNLVLDTGGGLRALDVDPLAGKMYWTDVNNFVIRRANLDGTDQQDLITSGLEFPAAIAVDPVGGKMYWGDQVSNELRRANLDGSDNELVRSTPFHRGVALDTRQGKVYWTTSITASFGEILRCDLDGSNPETVVTSTAAFFKPAAIALDLDGGKIYWTDFVVDVVRRSNLDGTDVQSLFFPPFNNNPRGIALDLADGKVYWGQDTDVKTTVGTLMRMDLDGASPEAVQENLGLVNYLALLPTATCLGNLNGDAAVNAADLALLLGAWGKNPGHPADFNDDDSVNAADLALLLGAWGDCG